MAVLFLSQVFRYALLVVMALALAGPARAQVTEHKLTASDGAGDDFFGWSVSLSGDRVLVGAIGDDDLGEASGAAYVYERQADGSWLEVAKLTASDGADHDEFGSSVSLSGDRALVGSPQDERGEASGAAYVFERQTNGSWLEVARLTASDGARGDEFGQSVSLLGDRALVGAIGDDDLGFASGAAYVYEWRTDGSWLEVAKLIASDGAIGDYFGLSVSLEGDRALVGAFGDNDQGNNSGSAYVVERQADGTWLEVAKLIASDGADHDFFGWSVSLSGDRALVAARLDDDLGEASGAAYVYERQADGSWLEVAKLTASGGASFDQFGHSVSLSGDRALVGAPRHILGFGGSAYLYARQGDGTWPEVTQFNASDGHEGDLFGFSVSLSGDRALAGSSFRDGDQGSLSGAAYVYDNLSSLPVAVAMTGDPPDSYLLSAPYPNPFNTQAHFSLAASQAQQVRIEVFDVLGRRVAVLHEGLLSGPATHHFTFEAGSLPSGVYLLRVTGERFAATRTTTFLK